MSKKPPKPRPKAKHYSFTVNSPDGVRGHGLRADELRVTEAGALIFFIKGEPNPVLVVAPHAYSYVLGGSLDRTGTWLVETPPSEGPTKT